jgi:hypothetical protein
MAWIEPVYPRIFGILKNPTYAGVFVWGRNHTRTSIVDGRARKTRGHARPLEQWEVTIPNHHEGYITWEEFMRNQQQIRSNAGWNARMGSANGAVRNGPALLTGLLRCGRCGRALQVAYTRSKQHGLLPRYWCSGNRSRQMVRSCITFAGTRVDQLVAIEVLEALRLLGVQAALDALDHSQNQTDEKRRSLELALQKARSGAGGIRTLGTGLKGVRADVCVSCAESTSSRILGDCLLPVRHTKQCGFAKLLEAKRWRLCG